MRQKTTHQEQLVFLKRIEGQIRGVQRMITERRYCVDILIQLHSIVGAILRVQDAILKKHLQGCVSSAMKRSSSAEKEKKLNEVMELIRRFRRGF